MINLENKTMKIVKSNLSIQGMHCASCAQTVSKALSKVDGVEDANVNIATERAYVTYNPHKVSKDELIKAIERAGYGATLNTEKIILKLSKKTSKNSMGI